MRNLYVCHTDLQQDFSCVSFSHQIERIVFDVRNSQSRDSVHTHLLDIQVCTKHQHSEHLQLHARAKLIRIILVRGLVQIGFLGLSKLLIID